MIQQQVKSKIVTIEDAAVSDALLVSCAAVLQQGEVLIAPTETRYGMLVNAFESKALEKLYKIKGRPDKMPMAVFLPTVSSIEEYALLPESALRLARAFLPGPLTLVLESVSELKSPIVRDGKIGIRVSSAAFIQALLKHITFPLTATSANSSGGDELATVREIYTVFGESVGMYVDNGVLEGKTSTVVEVTGETLRILREGAISEKEIREITG